MVSLKKYRKEIIFFSLALLVVVADQLSKYLILKFNPEINLKLFFIHLVRNSGAGFGILQEQTFLLIAIPILVIGLIAYYYKRIDKKLIPQTAAGLLLGGTIGNLIDRVGRKFVVDFIDFSFWPAFNLADACITIGAIGLVLWFWRKGEEKD